MIQADLRLTEAQLGLLFSAFFWTYSLVQIPVGWLAERYGAHRVLAAGLTLWAVATICVGVAHTFPVLLLLRLLLGIGESAGFPCVSKLLAAVVPIKSLGTANGIVAFAYLSGPAVGTYAGGQLMAYAGWRSAFLVFGGLSLVWLLPWSRVKLPPRAVRRSDADTPTLLTILKQPSLWGTALGLFSSNYTFYFLLSWLPFYLVRERGFSTTEMAALASSAYLVNAASAVSAGWVTDRLISNGRSTNAVYKTVMVLTHAGSVVCMLCMALGPRALALGAIFGYQVLCGVQSPRGVRHSTNSCRSPCRRPLGRNPELARQFRRHRRPRRDRLHHRQHAPLHRRVPARRRREPARRDRMVVDAPETRGVAVGCALAQPSSR